MQEQSYDVSVIQRESRLIRVRVLRVKGETGLLAHTVLRAWLRDSGFRTHSARRSVKQSSVVNNQR